MKRLISSIPAGVWIVASVALVFGGQALWKSTGHSSHLDALAEESGNLSFMLENERPQISHNGTRLLFCHSSEKGVGVFVCDVATGQKKLLFEEKEIHFGLGPHGVLAPFPWSPDDRWLVYAHQGPGAINEETALPEETALTICRGDTDEEAASLIAPFGRVVALDWLTPDAFVYVDGTEGHDFMFVQKSSGGNWEQTRLDTPTFTPPPKMDNHFCALAAVSGDAIVWLQANCLWRLNVMSGKAEKLFAFPPDQFFTSLDYSKQTGQLLLSCIEAKTDSLWRMPLEEPGGLTKIASDVRTHDHSWNDAAWINDGRGYAFIRKPGLQTSGLVIKSDSTADQTILFPTNYIQFFITAPEQRRLFVVGDINRQPGSAIWEYDIAAGSQRCVVPGSDQPLKFLQHVPIRYENIKISAKEKLNVVVFPPAGLEPGSSRKCPVVIGSIRFVVEDPYLYQYPEAVANAGGWFLMIDHDWSPKSLGSWAWHIGNLAGFMVRSPRQFPNVDRHRIFVLSNSAQSLGLPALFTNRPGLFCGAILQAPSGNLYEPSRWAGWSRPPAKMLVTAESHYPSADYLEHYQTAAGGVGLQMDWIIHADTPHEFIAKQSQRARIQTMLHFIFDE